MPDDTTKNGELTKIKERLAVIETTVLYIKERGDRLETSVTRQYLIAMTLGAVGAGAVLLLRQGF